MRAEAEEEEKKRTVQEDEWVRRRTAPISEETIREAAKMYESSAAAWRGERAAVINAMLKPWGTDASGGSSSTIRFNTCRCCLRKPWWASGGGGRGGGFGEGLVSSAEDEQAKAAYAFLRLTSTKTKTTTEANRHKRATPP